MIKQILALGIKKRFFGVGKSRCICTLSIYDKMIGKKLLFLVKKLIFYSIICFTIIKLLIVLRIDTYYWRYRLQSVGANRGTIVTFEEKLIAIAHKTDPHKNPENLFLSRDFVWIYRHPSCYLPHVISLLNNPSCSEAEKLIAIYGMEKLDLDNYLLLLQEGIKLYQKGIISQELLNILLGFSLAECHPLIKNYQSIHTVDFLNAIRSLRIPWNLFDYIPEHITSILSGNALRKWQIRKELPEIKKIMQDITVPPFRTITTNQLSFSSGYYQYSGPEKSVELLIVVNGKRVDYPLLVEHNLDPLFAEIYFHPIDYMQEAMDLIEDPSFDSMLKKKVIYAMRRLPLKQHIIFVKFCCNAYIRNKIPQSLLMYMLNDFCRALKVPPTIVEAYKNKEVRQLLMEIQKIESLPNEFISAIQGVMSGRSKWIFHASLIKGWPAFKNKFTDFTYGPIEYPVIDFTDGNITIYHSLYGKDSNYMYLYEDVYPTKRWSLLSCFISLKKQFYFYIREIHKKLML